MFNPFGFIVGGGGGSGGGGLGVFGPVLGALDGGAGEQQAEQQKATAQQQDFIKWMMQQQQQATNQALGHIDSGYNSAMDYASYGGAGALDTLNQGFEQGADTLQQYGQSAQDSLSQGYSSSLEQLYGGQDSAAGSINQALGNAGETLAPTLALQSNGQRLSDMLASGPYNNFTQDPGYAFRLQQGQEALAHAASAQGGRHGGDTLKALADYNQNFASNEFGNYVNRQNNVMSQMSGLAGLGAGAAGQMAGLQHASGSALAGLYSNTGQQAAGLSQAYGQGSSNLYNMQGSQLSDLYTGWGQSAAGQENLNWQSMANLFTGQANASANALTGGAAAQGNIGQLMLPTYSAGVGYAGSEDQTFMNLLQMGLAGAAIASDERLKTNIEPADDKVQEFLGELEPVAFDYKDTKHGAGRHVGVLAQDVERSEMGREIVVETPDGKMLDARKVLSAVLAALAQINARLERLEAAHA